MRYYILMAMMLLLGAGSAKASAYDDTSVAGLFPVSNQGREVWNFNPNWRFHLGDVLGAERADYDDTSWGVVSTPHSVKLEPAEASGCRNYQGIAWYRKTFIVPGNRSEIYFEAIMGKQKIYVNGKLAKEHFGGYLPVIVNLKEQGLKKGDKCVVAVMADNSNDKSYPPGKPQYTLDFAYHGGIYRDVWLINKKEISITNVIEADRRDAGIFVHFSDISEKQAKVFVDVDLQNVGGKARKVKVEQSLLDASGKVLKTISQNVLLAAGDAHQTVRQMFSVRNPHLWSPETPYLYSVVTRIKDGKQVLDGGKTKLGIRSFEFRGKEGFWLNGKKYRQFIGANRHQDFAYVGNALPNSQQWRDVLRLKNAGFNIIRTAHYPQDPSFMDACDELGIFIIVATPGWQYWNKDPQFAERVFQNTREIIRRDRNHPSVLMWEPILNETRYPKDFALKSLQLTKDEYPYPYRPVAVADWNSAGVKENYDVVYGWPDMDMSGISQCVFTREFGEYVDDWYAHNNLNRASRSWGEKPMLTQAYSLAKTTEEMHTPGQFIGGCQWHPFDHQRGYHPDPFYGGVMDVFRQPKYAYYMFKAQRSPEKQDRLFETGPMVYIAHEMTPFSPKDVTVYSNCDEVRLTYNKSGKTWTYTKPATKEGMPSPVITFKDIYDFMIDKNMSMRKKKQDEVFLLAEGIIDGKVVATHEVRPARRPEKVLLWVDNENTDLKADGSDFVTVVAAIADKNGNIKRLNNYYVKFHVEGEGRILGGANILANPAPVKWGTAPVLIQSTLKPGKIKITASVLFEGSQMPASAVLELESKPAAHPLIYTESEAALISMNSDSPFGQSAAKSASELEQERLLKERNAQKLKEVEKQQADFGEKK